MARLLITPPIPRYRGLVTGEPGQLVHVSYNGADGSPVSVADERLGDTGELYFNAKAGVRYVAVIGNTYHIAAAPNNRTFNDGFRADSGRWQIRQTEYIPESSDYARASEDNIFYTGSKLCLDITQRADAKFTTGHVWDSEFRFTHGWASARMKMPPYHGAQAGFWLQASDTYVTPQDTEIDVVECFGAHDPEGRRGTNIHHTIWWKNEAGEMTSSAVSVNSLDIKKRFDLDYHVYSVFWDEYSYEFWVDGKRTAVITDTPSSTEHFMVLSLLVRNFEYSDLLHHLDALDTYKFYIDWVRVWQ